MIWFAYVLALLPFYLLGAFPTGRLVAKLNGVDIEKVGSGNVGATNVARVIGKKAGIITLILDALKGALAVCLANLLLDSSLQALAGVLAVFGHCFSIPGKLKGGKGVATALGVTLALNWSIGISAIIIFAITFFVSGIVSLASIVAALSTPLVALLMSAPDSTSGALCVIGLTIVLRHRENIDRLTKGTESKFKFGEKKTA